MARLVSLWLPILVGFSTASIAEASTSDADCYDLKVNARVVEQIPSEIPGCSDCIIMSWPWFIDLKVKRVLEGDDKSKMIRALSIQHTYLVSRYGTWRLRRNAAGGFNVVAATALQRCSANISPAPPYLRPSSGDSLDVLRDKGEKLYGRHPS